MTRPLLTATLCVIATAASSIYGVEHDEHDHAATTPVADEKVSAHPDEHAGTSKEWPLQNPSVTLVSAQPPGSCSIQSQQ